MSPLAITRRIAVIALIGGLGGGLVFPILPALGLQLGIPAAMVGLILSANRIARLIFNLPAGHLIDRLGPRLVLCGALLIETVGVLGFSAALQFGHAMWWLLAGRIVFGIGTAFLMVGAQAAVLRLTERADRGRRMATVRVAISVAVPGGLILGGLIADRCSDNAAFLTGAAVTCLGAIFAWLALPPFPREHGEEARRAGPLKSIAALRGNPQFPVVLAACAFNMLIFLTVQGVLLCTMVLLVGDRHVQVFGLQAQGTSGLAMAVLVGCSAIISLLIGRAIDRLPHRATLIVPALLVLAVGFATLAFAQTLWPMLAGTVLVGLSYNGVTLPMLALLGDAVTDRQHGPAVGLYQFFGDIGGTIGPLLGIEAATRLGLTPLYLCLAVLPLLAVLAALRLLTHERRIAEAA